MKASAGGLVTSLFLALLACSSSKESEEGPQSPRDGGSDAPAAEPYPPPAPDACITDVTPGLQKLECEGLRFDLNVPEICLTERCGFITDVHGFGMNGDVMDVHSRMRELAGAKGYIVLQPSAPGALLASAWTVDHDVSVRALMQHVIDVWHPDPKRIHFDGYSMGGWMTWRFVCQHADLIASAAPIAAGLAATGARCSFSGAEIPSREMPIFYTHGRTDGLVSFSQATAMHDALTAAWYPGVTAETVGEASDYRWVRYTNANGTVFEFVEHDWECAFVLGAISLRGHCFPGSDQFLGCGATNPFDWGETVLQFFIDHPME